MTITIRPFERTEQAYTLIAQLHNAVWPDHPETADTLKHADGARRDGLLFERFILELEGHPVGVGYYAEPTYSNAPGNYRIEGLVIPEARGRGVGTAFYEKAVQELAHRHPRPTLLLALTRENHTGAVRFLEKQGYQAVMRYPISMLDVRSFDVEGYRPLLAKVAQSGLRIRSLAQLAGEESPATQTGWQQRLYELWEHRLMQDVPMPYAYTPKSFEEFSQSFFHSPRFDPHTTLVASDGPDYVGLCALIKVSGRPDKYFTELTGILRSHRRQGIATALKVLGIESVQKQGVQLIETDNEENNPMYTLNMQLGFRPEPAWIDYEKNWAA